MHACQHTRTKVRQKGGRAALHFSVKFIWQFNVSCQIFGSENNEELDIGAAQFSLTFARFQIQGNPERGSLKNDQSR